MKFDGTATNTSSTETLTVEKIMSAVQALKSLPPVPRMPRLIASEMCENVPRMTLSEAVPVSPAFRAEINAWMRDFFGVHDTAYEFEDPATGERALVTSQRIVESLESQRLASDLASSFFQGL